MNSGAHEDGVVFHGIEPMQDAHCFIGRTSIIEAVAALYGTTPNDITARIEQESPEQAEIDALVARIAELEADKERFDALRDALAGAGVIENWME